MSSEQWKEEGNCKLCRKSKYCKKYCKAKSDNVKNEFSRAVSKILFQGILGDRE